jgi:hypothetical protein
MQALRRSGMLSPGQNGQRSTVTVARVEYELKAGGRYSHRASAEMKAMGMPDEMIVGEVIESDPPRKLVQTWHPLFDATSSAEPHTRLHGHHNPRRRRCADGRRHGACWRRCLAISSRCWRPASGCRSKLSPICGRKGGARRSSASLPIADVHVRAFRFWYVPIMLRKVSNASTHRGCRANIFSAACLALRGPRRPRRDRRRRTARRQAACPNRRWA